MLPHKTVFDDDLIFEWKSTIFWKYFTQNDLFKCVETNNNDKNDLNVQNYF
jgi:hypothetical protein